MPKGKKQKQEVSEEAELFQQQLGQLKSQLVRSLADYDNLVKRVERDRETIEKIVSLRLILKFLTVLDGLENAQMYLQDAGLAISISEFKKVLSEEGLTEIKPETGSEFNEEEMEVVEVMEGVSDNTVSEVVLTGWKYSDGTVVRHAKVKVIKKEEI